MDQRAWNEPCRHSHRHAGQYYQRPGALRGTAGYGANYGERIRGYFTAPLTGNYYFWIAASDSAQLWISDDNGAVNNVLRASVAAPGVAAGQWTAQTGQQSPWLSLAGGQAYYMEILHKVGLNSNANWSVGWLQDPHRHEYDSRGTCPELSFVPLLSALAGQRSRHVVFGQHALPARREQPGRRIGDVAPQLRRHPGNPQLPIDDLQGTPTGESINSDPYLSDPGELIFDISGAKAQSEWSYLLEHKGNRTAGRRVRTSLKSSAKEKRRL